MYIYDSRSGLQYPSRKAITLLPSGRYDYLGRHSGLGDVLPQDFNIKTKQEFALGKTKGDLPITAHYFPGEVDSISHYFKTRSARLTDATFGKALVIAGVHGSELSGIEAAEKLVDSLKKGIKPFFSVIVVPELFRDNAAVARNRARKLIEDRKKLKKKVGLLGEDDNTGRFTKAGAVDPNRQCPKPGSDFDVANPVDAEGRPIELENQLLFQLIQEFKPNRIATVHAKAFLAEQASAFAKGRVAWETGGRKVILPGVFADPHSWPPGAKIEDQKAAYARTCRDASLAIAMSRRAETGGARVPGNWPGSTCLKSSAAVDTCPMWQYAGVPPAKGTSLGGWGPHPTKSRSAITVITIEVQHYYSTELIRLGGTPTNKETASGVSNRENELNAHRDAIIEVFLKQR